MRCVLTTPFGAPVEPDVNRIFAIESGPSRANASSTAAVALVLVHCRVVHAQYRVLCLRCRVVHARRRVLCLRCRARFCQCARYQIRGNVHTRNVEPERGDGGLESAARRRVERAGPQQRGRFV